jgi:hypothetical protein
MTVLQDYRHFGGRHWETGSVHNFYAYRGVKAPHTGKPYSEALLLGISGGIAMGYFTFAYEGYDPQCIILTRNTFDPLDRLLSRLGVVQDVKQTAKAEKAQEILLNTLADGSPAILWADMWSLPYNRLPHDEGMWGSFPIVVYGYDREADLVYIVDRANVPLTVSTRDLAAARGRIKKDKHRLMTLDIPDPAKLASAVRLGITDCIQLFTEKPPKGTANNFGLAAFQFWAKMLANPKERTSWAKLFPPGVAMYAGLTWAYSLAFRLGKGLDGDAERGTYADFLDEAAVILGKPLLREAAHRFRASAEAWRALPRVLLPDHIPPFAQGRRLMWRRHECFLQQGNAALDEMREIDDQLAGIRRSMRHDFPLTEAEVVALREQIAEQVLRIHDLERAAVLAMKEAMA